MAVIVLSRRNVAALKVSLLQTFPEVRSSHADEALAAGIGFRTYAALLAALKAQGSGSRVNVFLSEEMVGKRLKELSGFDVDILAKWRIWEALPDASDVAPSIGNWWKNVANEN
jgi:hypothetical protein